jgi:hypothetical protein
MSDSGSMSRIVAGLISGAATLAAALLTLWLRDRTRLSKRIQMFDAAAKELGFWEIVLRMQNQFPQEQRHNLQTRAAHHLRAMVDELTAAMPETENRFIYRHTFWGHGSAWTRAVEVGQRLHKRQTYEWRKLKCAIRILLTKTIRIVCSAGVLAGFVMFGYGIYRALSQRNPRELQTTVGAIGILVISLFVGAFMMPFEEDAEREWEERYNRERKPVDEP